MDTRTDAINAADRSDTRRLAAQWVWYLTLSVVFGIVIVAALVSALAVRPEYCALCHRDGYVALKSSKHASVSCDACHTSPNAFAVIDSRLAIVGMLPAKALGARTGGRAVANDGCVSCHAGMLNRTVTVSGLRMSHRELVAAKWSCAKCHADAAHGSAAAYNAGYTMDMCLGCHTTNYKNLETCAKCHTGAFPAKSKGPTPWRVTHGTNWRQTHGMGDLTTCKSCHPGNYCVQCHNMILPHPPNFPTTHGKAVVARPETRSDCLVCHRATACDDCHRIAMPHPDGFIRTHKDSVKTLGEPVCVRCHDKKSCTECHSRHIHPGVPPEQLKLLQAKPVKQ